MTRLRNGVTSTEVSFYPTHFISVYDMTWKCSFIRNIRSSCVVTRDHHRMLSMSYVFGQRGSRSNFTYFRCSCVFFYRLDHPQDNCWNLIFGHISAFRHTGTDQDEMLRSFAPVSIWWMEQWAWYQKN